MKPTAKLHEVGQSLWLDNITRPMLDDGTLERYIDELSVTGLTSNPTIFDKAISGGEAYDEQIAELARAAPAPTRRSSSSWRSPTCATRPTSSPACTTRTDGVDGWVSLEVSPLLADDAEATIEQAATPARQGRARQPLHQDPGDRGRPARRSRSRSSPAIPINVTLLFDDKQYLGAADAYMRGVERRIEAGLDPNVASVASLFISRWDVAVSDEVPDGAAQPPRHRDRRPRLPRLPRAARLRPLAAAAQRGRPPPAPALGQHRDQGPRRLRHALHRGARLARSRSTRCPSRPCSPSPTTARSATCCRPTAATPSRCWPSSPRPASTSPRSPPASRRRARRASTSPGKSCCRRSSRQRGVTAG